MRNLKRVLSLGMTAAMISGLMVSAGAAGYTDVTAEDNVEAIEVLQTVGIMVGDSNGNFNPDQNVTRNEMAVIMANLMDYRVATYAGTSPFTDVPSWAEQYVAACYANGIVAGTSATTFGGNDTVTAGQAALMLMKALGYFKYQSDFGSDWLLATTQVGTRINLFSGVEAGVREAMTRNDVAQLVLNTLRATMVDAENNGVSVEGDGISITTGNTKYYYRVDTKGGSSSSAGGGSAKYNAIDRDKTATGIDNATGRTLELGEELFEGDLKRNRVSDTYGRPSTEWKYKLDVIGTYADGALAVYNTKVSKGELYDLIGKSNIDNLNAPTTDKKPVLTVYSNGVDDAYFTTADVTKKMVGKDELFDRNSTGAAGIAYTNAVAGNGVQTEVYLDGDGNVTVVYINTYLMRAIDDYNADKGVINVEVLTDPAVMNSTDSVNVVQLSDDEFENIKNFKEGDYIQYTVGDDGRSVASVAAAKVVTGKVDAYSEGSYVTLDGTKYEYSSKIEGAKQSSGDKLEDSAATKYRVGDTASIVVDDYGYVLYVDSAAISLGNYLYVLDTGNSGSTSLSRGDTVAAIFTDGTAREVPVSKVYEVKDVADTKAATAGNGRLEEGEKLEENEVKVTSAIEGKWYSYSVNSSGQYTLREAFDANVYSDEGDKTVTGGQADFTKRALANEKSVLVVYNQDDKEVTAYTGAKNFPTIKDGATTVKYVADSRTGYVLMAYIEVTDSSKIEDNGEENLTIFLKKNSTYIDTADNEEVHVWSVIMDGEVKEIELKGKVLAPEAGDMYYKLSTDKDGFYENGKKFETGKKNTFFEGTINGGLTVEGSALKIGGIDNYLVTSDTEIVVVMRPDGSGEENLKTGLMVDSAASWETKTVNGKQLNNMFGSYKKVYGSFYMVRSASDSYALDTLYLDITGVGEKK